MRKGILFCFLSLFTVCAVNAFDVDSAVDASLSAAIENAYEGQKQVVYSYNPIVFKVDTYFENFLYKYDDGRKIDYTSKLLDNFMANGTDAECYATGLVKGWVAMPAKCIYMEDRPGTGPEYGDLTWSFKAKSMTFTKDGYKATVDLYKNKPKFFIDYETGMAIVNLDSICLSSAEKISTNVCIRFIDFIASGNNGNFKIGESYSTIVLSGIDTPSKYKEAFTSRRFFTPNAATSPITISDVNGRVLVPHATVKDIKDAYVGEPLFFNAGGKKVLVGFNKDTSEKAKNRAYITLGSNFTETLKEALGADFNKIKVTDTFKI